MTKKESRTPFAPVTPIFTTVALVFIISGALLFWMQRVIQRAERDVANEHAINDELLLTLSSIKDAETGQRGYLLTGNDAYLKAYSEALPQISQERADLDIYAKAGRLPPATVAQFQQLATAKLNELADTIDLRKTKGYEAAVAVVQNNSGQRYMERLRALVDHMSDSGALVEGQVRSTVNHLIQATAALFAVIFILNLAVLVWAWRRVQLEIDLKTAAAIEAQRQRELLRVTLASIGDGVIVTDTVGVITFINNVAARLCGWTEKEAVGNRCEKVFKIVNEASRKSVESPVARVIRTGTIVGLANHTVLIRKDGVEVPIDDSGAPIHDTDGSLRGVVLVFRDFTEHKNAESALRVAMDDARAANIAKDNFLATLSHELRTPLTPVVMTLTRWMQAAQPPASWQQDVEMMQRNLDLEARLIDDLLDLTRIVRGKLSLNLTIADVNDLVGSVARMYRSEISAKSLRLSLDLRAPSHHARVDPARLQQVILNVLKNATKFTPREGSIEIRTTNQNQHILITIQDTGIGMTSETQSRLFRPFEQGADEIVKSYGGLGLGMAISKALMEVQGGSIFAHSEGPGLGSTFTMSIAVTEPSQSDLSLAPAPASAAPQRAGRILVVEDHMDTAHALARLLERAEHQVTLAHSISEAREALQREHFDLILSDIGLPDGTGIDLIRQVRSITPLPAIALSGFGMEDDVASCLAAGFDDHLTKPINFHKLESIVSRLMRNAPGVNGDAPAPATDFTSRTD